MGIMMFSCAVKSCSRKWNWKMKPEQRVALAGKLVVGQVGHGLAADDQPPGVGPVEQPEDV